MITLSAIHNARILIVDDQEANLKLLEYMLGGSGYTSVTPMMDSRKVLELHKANRYDLIVLDLNMPYMSGFEVLEQLKQVEPEGYLPVLVVTAEPAHKLRALETGAKDFISKPFDNIEVLTRIRNMLEVRLLYTQTRDYGLRLARYDTLTGLPNRKLFLESLDEALRHASENRGTVAVLLIDLDRFKNVNDTLGHISGDELLRQFAHRLVQCAAGRDAVGRLGGDEFAVIVSMPANQQDAVAVANRIRFALQQSFSLGNQEIVATASIGIAVYPTDASDTEALVKFADTAMYRAKDSGRDTYCFFTAEMNARAQRHLQLENALRKAADHGEFALYYQPKVQVSTGRIVGAEALMRWARPGHGLVPPSEFIPILEETGLIGRVGAWAIDAACRQIAEWTRSTFGGIHVAVNVSGRQFADGNLESVVMKAIRDSGIEPDMLELELTESSLMENVERTIATLHNLKAQGVQISIDDFGTGYSSLAYLKRFPIDKLKIDIAFIRDVTTNPEDAAIALAVIGMAHSLNLDVVAEGVETAAQLAYLSRHSCDQIQGYYFSPPVPAQEFGQMLLERKTMPLPAGEPAMPPRTLLIVDDEQSVLNSLNRLLRQDGYNILTATSAAEGFEKLALNPVHVVLCDQRMPEMNGTEFLDKVKNLYPDTFRIVLSGYTDVDAIMDAINRGALYRFFTKPWDNKALRDNIRAAFRHYWQMHGMAPAEIEATLVRADTDIE